MTPSAQASGGRQKTWTRDTIVTALKRYASLYGEDFTAAAFSPSTAKWRDESYLADRYFAGDPETGDRWPSLNAIKTPFGGSFNAAREAAGMSANKPGPSKRRRADHAHAPVRDVKHVTRVVHFEKDGGEARARAERRAARAEAKVERLEARIEALKARKPKAITKTKTKTKVKVVKERDLRALTAARAQAKEARATAARLAARLERQEAKAQETIKALRAAKVVLAGEVADLRKRAERAEAAVEVVEVERVVEVEVERVVELPAPEQKVVDAALRDAMLARRDAASADRRATASDKAYFELAAAAKGEARRLSRGELAELRESGPAGPAVMADALKRLAAARAGRGDMAAALTAVASAALGWKDRIQ